MFSALIKNKIIKLNIILKSSSASVLIYIKYFISFTLMCK